MIVIHDSFFEIAIPNNTEYAIFSKDYFLDSEGNIIDETGRTDVYEYGDIIITTARTKYTIERVYAAYDYVAAIIRYIDKNIHEPVIIINMGKLNENWDYHHEGALIVQEIQNR